MKTQNGNYLSYLLRIWKDNSDEEWRATLQDVFSGDSLHFATLPELYANLKEKTSKNKEGMEVMTLGFYQIHGSDEGE